MQSMRELNGLMPGLLSCDCDDVIMSRDVRVRCERVRARFRAATNLACHGTYADCGSTSARTHDPPQS